MMPILAFTLTVLIGQTVSATEINVPYLRGLVANEIKTSDETNLELAAALLAVNKTTFADTVQNLPIQLAQVGTGINQNIVTLNNVIASLAVSDNNTGPGNVYIANQTFNNLAQDIANEVTYFQSAYTQNAAFIDELQNNVVNVTLDSNGDFTLPPNVGPTLLGIKSQLVTSFQSLSTSCKTLENILKQVSLSVASQNVTGAQLFDDAAVGFAYGVMSYANISSSIQNALNQFIGIGMNVPNQTLHIPAAQFISILNTEMNGIGAAFDNMEAGVNNVGNNLSNENVIAAL